MVELCIICSSSSNNNNNDDDNEAVKRSSSDYTTTTSSTITATTTTNNNNDKQPDLYICQFSPYIIESGPLRWQYDSRNNGGVGESIHIDWRGFKPNSGQDSVRVEVVIPDLAGAGGSACSPSSRRLCEMN